MKKLFLLTSVLAIAACGGGGGGSGGGGVAPISAPVVPDILGGAVSAAAQTSNENVTKMKGEVIVAQGWNSPLSRGSSTNVDGVNFYQYELDDIRLLMADEVNTGQGYLNISMDDDGRIDAIKMMVGGVGADVARVGDTNQFNGPIFEFVRDSYAQVENNDFVVANDLDTITARMKSVLATQYGLSGGEWEQQGSGDWKYKIGENYATLGSTEAISNNEGAMLSAIGWALNFDDGKWVTVDDGDNYKYQEYGDQAVFRMPETADTTMATLNTAAATLGVGHWNRVDEVMNVVTLGGDIDGNGTSLQYADFGHFNPVYNTKDIDVYAGHTGAWTNRGDNKSHTPEQVTAGLAKEDYQLFAGGYAITGISNGYSLTPENNTSYHGKAIGRVYTSIQGDNHAVRESHFAENGITSGDGHDIAKAYTTTHATMTIGADGTQTLVMPFNTHSDTADTFYDITITKNPDASIDLDFAGTPSETQYQLYNAEANMVPAQNTFSPRYYGVNTPSEAAGTARFYSEENYGDGATREYELQAAWGMKKD